MQTIALISLYQFTKYILYRYYAKYSVHIYLLKKSYCLQGTTSFGTD